MVVLSTHVAVISSHLFSSLLVVVRRKRSARLLTAYWRDVAVSGVVAVEVVDGGVCVCAVGVGAVPEVAGLFWVGV